uniref:Uncharacterized protein n=1 Tax=Astyanax mexicanus TaxID=7994 RepID=W5KKX1_ASTMX
MNQWKNCVNITVHSSAVLFTPLCRLWSCSITEEGCAALASALKSNPSHLRVLDLRLNKPGKSGKKLLSDLQKDPHFKLETLYCNLSDKSCADLASALSSNPSTLRELNLNNNKLQDSGVKLLSAGLKSSHCKLEKLKNNKINKEINKTNYLTATKVV